MERIREYISLSLPRTDVGGIIVQAHEVPTHSYMGCLKLLINNWVFVAAIYSLCRKLLSSVRARYLFREDLVNYSGKWTSTGEGIQHLRELSGAEGHLQ